MRLETIIEAEAGVVEQRLKGGVGKVEKAAGLSKDGCLFEGSVGEGMFEIQRRGMRHTHLRPLFIGKWEEFEGEGGAAGARLTRITVQVRPDWSAVAVLQVVAPIIVYSGLQLVMSRGLAAVITLGLFCVGVGMTVGLARGAWQDLVRMLEG